MHTIFFITYVIVLLQNFSYVFGSAGDLSPFYQNCLRSCLKANCTQDGSFNSESAERQDTWCWLLRWSCKDECRYLCMWPTVQGFKERHYDTPKFHGKWPFKRVLGIQEPASAFASLLNLAAHLYMYMKLINQLSVKYTPLALFWHIFAIVCINAWVWSTIFHTRDIPFTEFMDYACALSMVMALFVAAVVRIFHRRRKFVAVILFMLLFYYIEHARYLYTGKVDYEYNMMVNVVFGTAGALAWSAFAVFKLLNGRHYAWRMLAFNVLSGAALLLELFDFPPKYNAWDAHALWHLSTAPLPLIFYRFIMDDLHELQSPLSSEKHDIKLS